MLIIDKVGSVVLLKYNGPLSLDFSYKLKIPGEEHVANWKVIYISSIGASLL